MIEEIKAARRSVGWSQRTLAERIGVDAQTIKRVENGVGSVATLMTVLAALDFQLTGLPPGRTMAERLRSARRKRSLSLDKVAARAGMSRVTIANLESGGGSVTSLLRLLKVVAPNVRRRAPERAYWGEGDKEDRDSRFTPHEFMTNIYAAFGEVDLDPCAHLLSPVVAHRRILRSDGGDGLVDNWSGRFAYVNPPFSELSKWLRRAHEQWRDGNVEAVVCLAPVRTDSAWFHSTLLIDADIYLLQGRVRFLDTQGKAQPTPFSLMLVTLGTSEEQRVKYANLVSGVWMARNTIAADQSRTSAL